MGFKLCIEKVAGLGTNESSGRQSKREKEESLNFSIHEHIFLPATVHQQ